MIININFNSDEAIYLQLRNQIVMGIATSQLCEGDALPSVRQLAESIGINMHTVNKAYAVLRQDGFIQMDRRRGAIVAIDIEKQRALNAVRGDLMVVLAEASCRGLSKQEIHNLIDEIYDSYGGL